MLKVTDRELSARHSAAWISPGGEFVPLVGDQHHALVASDFPGMPDDDQLARDYPSTYAVARLRYVKVSNPFQCAWNGQGGHGDPRMETMADYMAQATVWLAGKSHDPWGDSAAVRDPIDHRVYVTTVTSPDPFSKNSAEIETTTVGDFMDDYASREATEFLYGELIGEGFVRACRHAEAHAVGRLISEGLTDIDPDRVRRRVTAAMRRQWAGRVGSLLG